MLNIKLFHDNQVQHSILHHLYFEHKTFQVAKLIFFSRFVAYHLYDIVTN
jgi:hypothetical protein